MVRDGIPFVIVPIVLAIVPIIFGFWWLAIPFLFLAGFMAFFFRDPRRSIPLEPGIIVAPPLCWVAGWGGHPPTLLYAERPVFARR